MVVPRGIEGSSQIFGLAYLMLLAFVEFLGSLGWGLYLGYFEIFLWTKREIFWRSQM